MKLSIAFTALVLATAQADRTLKKGKGCKKSKNDGKENANWGFQVLF